LPGHHEGYQQKRREPGGEVHDFIVSTCGEEQTSEFAAQFKLLATTSANRAHPAMSSSVFAQLRRVADR